MGDESYRDVIERVTRLVDRHCRSAPPMLAQPWESGLLSGGFPAEFPPAIPVAVMPPRPPELGVTRPESDPTRARRVEPRKRPRPRAWREDMDHRRQVAIHAWMALFQGFEDHSEVGRQLAQAPDEDARYGILTDVFADKATSTLKARAGALNGFWMWTRSRGVAPSPLVEQVVYEYCKYCQSNGASPTRAQSLKVAIAFASQVLGWVVQKSLLDSRRIAGVAFTELQRLPPVHRKEPLPPAFVRYLAKLVGGDDASSEAKVIAGFFLFLALTRARFSDGMAVRSEPSMSGKGQWIEATVKDYKTSKVRDRRGKDLPLVALALVGNIPWAMR